MSNNWDYFLFVNESKACKYIDNSIFIPKSFRAFRSSYQKNYFKNSKYDMRVNL